MALLALHAALVETFILAFAEFCGSLNMQTKFTKNANLIYNVPQTQQQVDELPIVSWPIQKAVHTYFLNTHAYTQTCNEVVPP